MCAAFQASHEKIHRRKSTPVDPTSIVILVIPFVDGIGRRINPFLLVVLKVQLIILRSRGISPSGIDQILIVEIANGSRAFDGFPVNLPLTSS